ncbi:unnamed protein product [Rhizophagus irregularis]|nr:unnamed protein product [Rhizophagus irregularis]
MISNNTQPTNKSKPNYNRRKNKICNKEICQSEKSPSTPQSGNKIVDDFISSTLKDRQRKMEYVPYDRFKDTKLIAEGGFSKIYNTTWIDGPICDWDDEIKIYKRFGETIIVLKELNNSKDVTLKDLNELNIFQYLTYDYSDNSSRIDLLKKDEDSYINIYYGITQHPITQNFMIIMEYHKLGDLTHYIARNFFDINWYNKLNILRNIIYGLKNIHDANIIHKDYHSGNIFLDKSTYHGNIFIKKDDCTSNIKAITGDLGLSAIEQSDNDDDEIYGIIPFVAPEIFQGQKYTKASDIYSFGMIMWELMTGRRPFWNQNHDIHLIIEICDGLRPPTVTDVPKGYTELMKKCWNSDPKKRPKAGEMSAEIETIGSNESKRNDSTKIIKSSDIGPKTTNDPDEDYESRYLSTIIKSVDTTRSSRTVLNKKRKFDDNLSEDKIAKRIKIFEHEYDGYFTMEIEFDIDIKY